MDDTERLNKLIKLIQRKRKEMREKQEEAAEKVNKYYFHSEDIIECLRYKDTVFHLSGILDACTELCRGRPMPGSELFEKSVTDLNK